jgi:hypothetical protein
MLFIDHVASSLVIQRAQSIQSIRICDTAFEYAVHRAWATMRQGDDETPHSFDAIG